MNPNPAPGPAVARPTFVGRATVSPIQVPAAAGFGRYNQIMGSCGTPVQPDLVGCSEETFSQKRLFRDTLNESDCIQCCFVTLAFYLPEICKTNIVRWAEPYSMNRNLQATQVSPGGVVIPRDTGKTCTMCHTYLPGNVDVLDMPLVIKLLDREKSCYHDSSNEGLNCTYVHLQDSMLVSVMDIYKHLPYASARKPFIMATQAFMSVLAFHLNGNKSEDIYGDPIYQPWTLVTKEYSEDFVSQYDERSGATVLNWQPGTDVTAVMQFFRIDLWSRAFGECGRNPTIVEHVPSTPVRIPNGSSYIQSIIDTMGSPQGVNWDQIWAQYRYT